jgi:hypothetical protein
MQVGRFFTDFLDALPKAIQNYSVADKTTAMALAKVARLNGMVFSVAGYSKPQVDIEKVFGGVPFTPPYPVTILEYILPPMQPQHQLISTTPRPRILIAKQEPEGVVLVPIEHYAELGVGWVPPYAMFMPTGETPNPMAVSSLLHDAFNSARKLVNEDRRDIYELVTNVMLADLATYAEFCRTVNENHVTFEDVEPDAKLNKMRRARGKAPLFTYKTLVIGKKKRKSQHLGGTHASPRSHLRRGHYRTSSKGVRYWVQPCMVKGETDGFVHKDYVVEGAADGHPS